MMAEGGNGQQGCRGSWSGRGMFSLRPGLKTVGMFLSFRDRGRTKETFLLVWGLIRLECRCLVLGMIFQDDFSLA